jgi:hypothetical protein
VTENSLGKQTLPSGVVPLALAMGSVALAIIELELYLTLPPIGRASCHGVKTAASMLFESVSEYGVSSGSVGLRNTRIMQRRHNGLSWFGPIRSLCPAADDPYTQEHLKSRGLQQSVKEEDLIGG